MIMILSEACMIYSTFISFIYMFNLNDFSIKLYKSDMNCGDSFDFELRDAQAQVLAGGSVSGHTVLFCSVLFVTD